MNKDLLELYSDYLSSSSTHATATGLSRMSEGRISHDRITRFLASEGMDSRTLWRLVKPLARQAESEDGVLVIDDTIEEKPYTDESELVCWHYDHSKGRSVKGVNPIGALYHSDGASIPVAFEAVKKSEWVFNEKKRGGGKGRAPEPRTNSTGGCSGLARRTGSGSVTS